MKILFVFLALFMWASEALAGAADIRIQLDQLKQSYKTEMTLINNSRNADAATDKSFYDDGVRNARANLQGAELKNALDSLKASAKVLKQYSVDSRKRQLQDARDTYRAKRTVLQGVLNANLVATNGLACFTRDGKKICFPKKSPD